MAAKPWTRGPIWYRRDDLDDLPRQPDPFRSDRLRELVDELPDDERQIVSRSFFGQAPDTVIAGELGITVREVRAALERAYGRLRPQVLDDHAMGTLRPAVDQVDGTDVVLGTRAVAS